jgi:hypothetical protein
MDRLTATSMADKVNQCALACSRNRTDAKVYEPCEKQCGVQYRLADKVGRIRACDAAEKALLF